MIRPNVDVFECDGPNCDKVDVVPATRLGLSQHSPEGWFLVAPSAPDVAPWVFCSKSCLYLWAGNLWACRE